MKIFAPFLFLLTLVANVQTDAANRFDFALPEHPGHLSLDRGRWKVTELSAKPNGRDRTQDDSLQKLKSNKAFWGFVTALSSQPKK